MLDTSARLLRLASLLQARPWWPGPDLADRLEITTRTLRRDIDRLRQLGYPIEATPGPAGGYRLGPGADLPPLLLDDDEAVAIAVCLRSGAAGSVEGLEEAAVAALAKVEQTLPARLRPRVNALAAVTVNLRGPDPAIESGALVAIAQACRSQERLRFRYTDRDGTPTERRTEPYRLVRAGPRWYLVARDLDRDDWRTFRVDRITEPEPTGHRFQFEDPPDVTELVSRATSVAPYRHQAAVVLDAPLHAVRDRVPATVAVLEDRGDGTTLMTTGSDDLDAIALHLAHLRMEFTVLEPPELLDHVRAIADRLARAGAGSGS